MASSIKEIKDALGIYSVSVAWNDFFPSKDAFLENADELLSEKIEKFYGILDRHNLCCKVTRKDLFNMCQIADSCDLMLVYIVDTPMRIEVFFCHKMITSDWLEQFKAICTRRQFFSLFQSLKNIKPVTNDFALSQYYQMVSPTLPFGYTASTLKLNSDYLLVVYRHDVDVPFFRVIKISDEGFESFAPEVSFNRDILDGIKFKFDGKVFTGDSLKTLWDGSEKKPYDDDTIDVNFNGQTYSLNTVTGIGRVDDEFFEVEKFRRGKHVEVVFEVDRHNRRALLLNNGFVWVLHNDTFYDIKSFKGLEQIDLNIFSMSSRDKGIVLSRDANSLELVPCSIFADLIYRLL